MPQPQPQGGLPRELPPDVERETGGARQRGAGRGRSARNSLHLVEKPSKRLPTLHQASSVASRLTRAGGGPPLLATTGCGAGRGEGDHGVCTLDAELGDEAQVAAVPTVGEIGEHSGVGGFIRGGGGGGERGEDGDDGQVDGEDGKSDSGGMVPILKIYSGI
uniref:DUF834 domain-containing protein n=1 Tax=Oryza rufipogon TaxID=4529 RepID=A0A0E0P6U0_ORYRU